MPFTDVTDGSRVILQGFVRQNIVVNAAVKPGDLIGLNASAQWVEADANATLNVKAKLIAGEAGASGDTIAAYKSALVGGFSGATKGDSVWLSDTVGDYSATKSTTFGQKVGVALTASEAYIDPEGFSPNEVENANEKRVVVSVDKTLALADCGIVQVVDTDAKIITLPAVAAGLVFTIENGGADAGVLVAISPAAVDSISGAGLTPADNKDLLNTKATAKKGDRVVLIGGDANGYTVQYLTGIWAREV